MTRIGIIGTGGVAKSHGRAINSLKERAQLAAIAEIDEERRNQYLEMYPAQPFASAEDMLADCDLDCVAICLPHHLHAHYAIAATRAGRHVLVEKPMAITVAECDQIVDAVDASGVKLTVGHSHRYQDGIWAGKKVLESGEVGKLLFAEFTFSKSWGAHKRKGWMNDRNCGGGNWWANGIHAVNVLQWLAQSPVASVKGFAGQCFHSKEEMDADDFGVTLMRHANNVQSVTLINGYRTGAPRYHLEMTCSAGMIRCERKALWVGKNNSWEERTFEAGNDKVREWEAFLDCIDADGEPASPAREGRDTVRIMEAVMESGRTGREVVFPSE